MQKSGYLVRRIIQALVTCFIAITFNFILFRALPGSEARTDRIAQTA